MNPLQILSDTNTEGEVTIETVPNQTGTVLVYTGDKKVSTRTNAQIISDLGLIGALNIAANYYNKTESDLRFEPKIPTGTSLQYIRGDKTLGFFPEYTFSDGLTDNFGNITPLYGTTAGTVAEGNHIHSNYQVNTNHKHFNLYTPTDSTTGVVRLYLGLIEGVINFDLLISSSYQDINAHGAIKVTGSVGSNIGFFWDNTVVIEDVFGNTSTNFYIEPTVKVDTLDGSLYLNIHKRVAALNPLIVHLTLYSGDNLSSFVPKFGAFNSTGAITNIENVPKFATNSALGNYLPLAGGTLSGAVYSNSTISVVSDGAGHDPYGKIGVTRGTASNFAYYGLTRSAQIGWSLGIDTSNRFIIGIGATTADKIITNTALALDQAGNVTTTDFYTPTHGNSIQWNEAYTNGVTLHTPQTIIAQKIFNGGSGDYFTEKAIMVNSNNSSLPGITFHKVGEYASIISLKLNEFNFLHLDGTNYANLKAAQYIVKDGTASQFLKADGSLDTNTYLTTSSAATNYVTKANVNENIDGQKSFLKRTFIWERLGLRNLAGVEKIILNSELSRIVVRQPDTSSEIALFAWGKSTDAISYPSFQLPPTASRLAIGCYFDAYNGYNLLIGGSARVDQAMDAGLLRKIGSNDDEILRGAGATATTDKEIQIKSGALRFVPEEFKFYSDGEVDTNRALVHVVIYDTTYNIDFRSASARQTYKIWNLSSNSCFMNIGAGFSISRYTMVEIYISDNGDKIITSEVGIGTL